MEMGEITQVRVAGESTLTIDQLHTPITPYSNIEISKNLDVKVSETSGSLHDMDKEGAIYELRSFDDTAEDTPSNLYPFPELPGAQPERRQFTVRAVVIGCALGSIVSASNIYLGLKTGWTFGASLFGSIIGFAILKPLSQRLPAHFGGGYFGK